MRGQERSKQNKKKRTKERIKDQGGGENIDNQQIGENKEEEEEEEEEEETFTLTKCYKIIINIQTCATSQLLQYHQQGGTGRGTGGRGAKERDSTTEEQTT